MSIISFSLKHLGLQVSHDLRINSVCIQCVRWKRKPRWLPTAKSRLFRIPERPKIDEREEIELKRLHDRYKTEVRSVRRYFTEEFAKSSATSIAAQQETKDEEEEHQRCMKVNEEWNRQVALIREKRLLQEQEAKRELILAQMTAFEEDQKKRMEEVEQIVREEKERAKFYITSENIDKAIEDALANPVDHNFAIDLQGNIYRGRKTKPTDVPPDEVEKIQIQGQVF
ncbi:small ribosomal subunit protein mS26 [Periplaneta americana]